MMKLLILYGASIDHKNAGALKHAVSNIRLDLSRTLVRAKNLDRRLASEAFCEIGSRASPNDRFELASTLIDRRPQRTPLYEALILTVNVMIFKQLGCQSRRMILIQL
jgi:hypothetical protein